MFTILSFLLLATTPSPATQDAVPLRLGHKQTTVIPSEFLRAYDPITVFFSKERGPKAGGAADEGALWLQIEPQHPGAFTWLDGKTLQFRPAVPWPALGRIKVSCEGRSHHLNVLMEAPRNLWPAPDSRGLHQPRDFTLAFLYPVDSAYLAQALSFRIQPESGSGPGHRLTTKDFTVKPLLGNGNDHPRYLVNLNQPVADGMRIRLDIQLTPQDQSRFVSYSWTTKEAFRLAGVAAGGNMLPLAASGSNYAADQALAAGPPGSSLDLVFSDEPGPIPLAALKQMVRIQPEVAGFRFEQQGERVRLFFGAESEHTYQLRILPVALTSVTGAPLQSFSPSTLYFAFQAPASILRWRKGHGTLERFGPQTLPAEGQATARADVRIIKIEPTDRRFWPFPDYPVAVNEMQPPPSPGEEPPAYLDMNRHIQLLGTPHHSEIASIPLPDRGSLTSFGFDLTAQLSQISGAGAPGHYLVGLRPLGGDDMRYYARIQVTDLSLTLIEDAGDSLVFAVHSLQKATPIGGAVVRIFGQAGGPDQTPPMMVQGTTDSNGRFRYTHQTPNERRQPFLLQVEKDGDTLIVNPNQPPPIYDQGTWFQDESNWLYWLANQPVRRLEEERVKAFVFTERPLYKPEEDVHIKGYVRTVKQGRYLLTGGKVSLQIQFPGDQSRTYPAELDRHGGFYLNFKEKDLPTGVYRVHVSQQVNGAVIGQTSFRMEPYRIPRFEVNLHSPDRVPNDAPFQVTLDARFYAGGPVAQHRVDWQVYAEPLRFRPKGFADFVLADDMRFSGRAPSQSEGLRQSQATTGADGSAVLELDPTLAGDGAPRRYLVEATVLGADEQTVSASKSIHVLPPFFLGLSLERVLNQSQSIKPRVVVLDSEGEPLSGVHVEVRLLHRQWHAYLRQSDFTSGKASYETDVVDTPVHQQRLVSSAQPAELDFSVDESGVYVVEITAQDRLGRAQLVRADVFLAGSTPIAWEKPEAGHFEVRADKNKYVPGETAQLVLSSPFQQGEALVVVEAADGNHYFNLAIRNGQAVFKLGISGDMAPRLPVHVLLMRGRLAGSGPSNPARESRARPLSLAATHWLKIEPVAHRVQLKLGHPLQVLPGQEMELLLEMTSPEGRPLDGSATVWLVDRAVLALAREGNLDPLEALQVDRGSHLRLADSRNEVLGDFFLEENPGGDVAEKREMAFSRVTVRRNFQTVPFYRAQVDVINGRASLVIPMPDNLTEFAVRAVGVTAERFGWAQSSVAVRLPVIVEPAMPRFLRAGDRFVAGAVGRIVHGDGGNVALSMELEGLALQQAPPGEQVWMPGQVHRVDAEMQTDMTPAAPGEPPAHARIRVKAVRLADGAGDGFEIQIPILSDRNWAHRSQMLVVQPDQPTPLPEAAAPIMPGSLTHKLWLSGNQGLLKILSALNYLGRYPHGCVEQRISAVFPALAMRTLLGSLDRDGLAVAGEQEVRDTLRFLEESQSEAGLFGYWPGSTPSVYLTAYALRFMVRAQQEGFAPETRMFDRAIQALEHALRSNDAYLSEVSAFEERCAALLALAEADRLDATYAHELFARARTSALRSEAAVLLAYNRSLGDRLEAMDTMRADLWDGLRFEPRGQQLVLAGLVSRVERWDNRVLPGEVQTLAAIAHALFLTQPGHERIPLLEAALFERADYDGWGDTHANASALLALAALPSPTAAGAPRFRVIDAQGGPQEISLNGEPVAYRRIEGAGPTKVEVLDVPGFVWSSLRYLPAVPGSKSEPAQAGFALSRELMLIDSDPKVSPERATVQAGATITLHQGQVIEDRLVLVNPEDRYFVAVQAPFASGFELLNPNLATAPPEAKPSTVPERAPDFRRFADDSVTFYYDFLPKGTYHFAFRLRATFPGLFTHPAAFAEMMYRQDVRGSSAGVGLQIQPK